MTTTAGNAACFPLVSVLVPLYNHERYIEDCLDSIIGDGYPNKEVIVIDDGSTDSSLATLHKWYAANGDRLTGRFDFSSRPNRGITRTLNELVEKAQGEYVAIVASDDYLLPLGLQKRVEYLQKHPERSAVMGDCIVVDQDGVKVHDSGLSGLYRGRKTHLSDDSLIGRELVFRWCVPGPVFMAGREVYEKIGGYDESIAVEDRDFYLRLVAGNLLGFVDWPVAAYRVHTSNFGSHPGRELLYSEAMLATFQKNIKNFHGLSRWYMTGEILSLQGLLARLRSERQFRGFLFRKLGKALISLTKRIYFSSSR